MAERARAIALALDQHAELLEAAAALHDIGYAPNFAKTGFHPLDGARDLRDVAGADERVDNLVAHTPAGGLRPRPVDCARTGGGVTQRERAPE